MFLSCCCQACHPCLFSLSTETTQWAKPSWCDIWVPVTRWLSTMIPTVKQMTTLWENDLASNSRSVKSSTVGHHIQPLGVCRHELDAIQDLSVLTQPKFWAWEKKKDMILNIYKDCAIISSLMCWCHPWSFTVEELSVYWVWRKTGMCWIWRMGMCVQIFYFF